MATSEGYQRYECGCESIYGGQKAQHWRLCEGHKKNPSSPVVEVKGGAK